MLDLVKKNTWFLIPLVVLLLVVLPFFFLYTKTNIHIFLNQYYSGFGDFLFKNITVLGSGIMPIIAGFIILFLSIRKSFIITSAGLFAGLSVQLLKKFVFFDLLRPTNPVLNIADLHLVEGIELHSTFSFPSGHSATIFALCLCLAIFSEGKIWKFMLFCLAVLVAYSRIYLSQHFLIDVYVGAIIGVISGILMAIIFTKGKAEWLDRSLIDLLFRKSY